MHSSSSGSNKCPFSGAIGAKQEVEEPSSRDQNIRKPLKDQGCYYGDYLQLDKLLTAQSPESSKHGNPAHDEMLFIIVHQAHELWFKQILHELDSCMAIFAMNFIHESHLLKIASRLQRITEIQKLLLSQLRVLETMTPMDFLDFRDYLFPASGFQSVQFRIIENKLGLKRDYRIKYKRMNYCQFLSKEHELEVSETEKVPSLFDRVDSWLSRMPFLVVEGFDFWKEFELRVGELISKEEEELDECMSLLEEDDNAKNRNPYEDRKESISLMRQSFDTIFNPEIHNRLIESGKRRMSHSAWKAALFIRMYRDLPVLQMPFQIIERLIDIDELMTSWRVAHSLMVHRMLGLKSGTGGSSGYEYLKATATFHKIFPDLFNMSEFLIPRSSLPKLPVEFKQEIVKYISDNSDLFL